MSRKWGLEAQFFQLSSLRTLGGLQKVGARTWVQGGKCMFVCLFDCLFGWLFLCLCDILDFLLLEHVWSPIYRCWVFAFKCKIYIYIIGCHKSGNTRKIWQKNRLFSYQADLYVKSPILMQGTSSPMWMHHWLLLIHWRWPDLQSSGKLQVFNQQRLSREFQSWTWEVVFCCFVVNSSSFSGLNGWKMQ